MNPSSTTPTAAPTIRVRDVKTLQRRVRAFTATNTMQAAPTSYHR